MNRKDRREKVLAKLLEQKSENQIERISNLVLVKLIESDFGIDLAGAITDETGSLFGYVIHKPTMLKEFDSGIFAGILVFCLEVSDTVSAAYLGGKLESLKVFNEDEKELCLNNIEQALFG